jgi:hypothetical protein
MQELPYSGIAVAAIQNNIGAGPKFFLMDRIGSPVGSVSVSVSVSAVLADGSFASFPVIIPVIKVFLIKAQ